MYPLGCTDNGNAQRLAYNKNFSAATNEPRCLKLATRNKSLDKEPINSFVSFIELLFDSFTLDFVLRIIISRTNINK